MTLAGGTTAAVRTGLGRALPSAARGEPLVVGIDVLQVSEQTTAVTRFGRAEVQLRWFRERDGGLVAQIQALVEGPSADRPDDPLAAALATSIDPLVASGLSLPDAAAPVAVEALPPARSTAPPLLTGAASRSFRYALTVSGVVSDRGGLEPLGARIALARRPVTDARWSFPIAVEVSALLTGNGDGALGGILAVGGAVQAARRLGRSTVYLQPGFQLSGGNEPGYRGDNHLFVGGRLGLELIRYPTKRGLVAGVGVHGTRRLGSDLNTPRDAGVSVTLGAQF